MIDETQEPGMKDDGSQHLPVSLEIAQEALETRPGIQDDIGRDKGLLIFIIGEISYLENLSEVLLETKQDMNPWLKEKLERDAERDKHDIELFLQLARGASLIQAIRTHPDNPDQFFHHWNNAVDAWRSDAQGRRKFKEQKLGTLEGAIDYAFRGYGCGVRGLDEEERAEIAERAKQRALEQAEKFRKELGVK